MEDFELLTQNYHLTTAEIIYFLPDHPSLLQSFIWQQYDVVPDYPVLRKFLDYWKHHIDGKLHSVSVASRLALSPAEFRYAAATLSVH